jgi:hypothetical protein
MFKKAATTLLLFASLIGVVWGMNNIYLQKEVYAKDKDYLVAGLETFREETVKQFNVIQEQSSKSGIRDKLYYFLQKKTELLEQIMKYREYLLKYPNDVTIQHEYEQLEDKLHNVEVEIETLEKQLEL